jgi:hypothetical protein
MKKTVITTGKDYTNVQPIFRELVLETGIKENDNIIFAGCPGGCYSSATNLSFGLNGLRLNQYFAANADINNLWHLEYIDNLGVVAARKASPVKARVIVLMSGLCKLPLENVLNFYKSSLMDDGVIIGQTVVPGLFEEEGWDKQIPIKFVFEHSIVEPTSFRVAESES